MEKPLMTDGQNMAWHYGKLLRISETLVPHDRIAVIEFDTGKQVSRGEFAKHVRSLACYLQEMGVKRGTKVAICARNRVEYLELAVAILQTGLVHVNLNFRYVANELFDIIDHMDVEILFFSSEFADRFEELRGRLTKVKHYFEFSDGDTPVFDGAHAYQDIVKTDRDREPEYSEANDDLFIMVTGGTTGPPKGVTWTQENLFLMSGSNYLAEGGPRMPEDENDYRTMVKANPGTHFLVNAPFMHGMGLYMSFSALMYGSTIVTNTGRFSAEQVLDAITQTKATFINVAGDTMAKPMYEALKANPGGWDMGSLMVMASSATLFSTPIKKGLIELIPHMTIVDILGGSESSKLADSIVNKDNVDTLDVEAGLELRLSENVKVFDSDFNEVKPNNPGKGILALSGVMAEGYYKSPEKTAETFRVIDGVRYCLLGDYVEVLADGSIKFLGRGNVCINSGGEKIFPEEVEQVLKLHASVLDCAIVGVLDDRWGEVVAAIVQLEPGAGFDPDAIRDFARGQLAGYKVPKHIIEKDDMERSPSGKLNYTACKAYASENL
jgi:acyl-CoA synthetase (AMP-forming)/AMP-acid ligase II